MASSQKQVSSFIDNECFYKQIFDSINVGMSVTNQEGYFLAANQFFCKIYGKSLPEIINQHFTTLIPHEHRELANDIHQAFMNGTVPEIHDDWHIERPDGSFVDVYSTPKLIIDDNGEKYKITTVVDITEYKRIHPCEQ